MGKSRRRSHIRGGFVNTYESNSATELSLAQGKNFDSIHSNQHGGQNISGMSSTMNSSMPGMDSSMPGMNSSMPGMDSSMPPMPGMNSSMSGMNSSMPPMSGMNSSMPGMNSSMPGMNSSTSGMNSSTSGMNSSTSGMNSSMPSMTGGVAPVGDQGLLDPSLRGSAHLDTLDRSLNEVAGMSDQAGGRRRRRKRATKRGRKSRKTRRRKTNRRRRMRGGDAPVNTPTMLLNGEQGQAAVNGMNPEWKLVEDASAFNPRA
jgi:hypothetical protein